MRKEVIFNDGWLFEMPGKEPQKVNVPHTWNGIDGQDGGGDYLRIVCTYTKEFSRPEFEFGGKCILQFRGVNSECEVLLNGEKVCKHEGGYSTFNVDITNKLLAENILKVLVSNEKNDRVYPQRADFTFYGGIYRDVYLITLPKSHFDFGEDASPPLKLTATVEGDKGILKVEAFPADKNAAVEITVLENGKAVASGSPGALIEIPSVRLWQGKKDPFLYTVKAVLKSGGKALDEVCGRTGFRSFSVDPEKGFFLNGESYPLRGVCRHQDRPKIGNAIGKAEHEEDMKLIMEIGANTVRLAHYQHDQYFYDLCDENGQVVWAEIPYISEYLPNADQNALDQMRELIRQSYNHPSIICWGISNEIMIGKQSGKNLQRLVKNHEDINALCKKEDPSRLTVVACYAMTGNTHPTAHVTDLVSWNLYYGWYVPNPFFFHMGIRMKGYHKKYPNIPLGLSEYGAEGMINLHSAKPRRFDNTEEYQAIYHEKNMEFISKNDWLWATHIWNTFDFGSDGRNQGGEPGMNHKGLITFDRKTKKDSFFLYKAYWSDEKFVHITQKRFVNRTGKKAEIKVYSNLGEVSLYNNGQLIDTVAADKVFKFKIDLAETNELVAQSGEFTDTVTLKKVKSPDNSYTLRKSKGESSKSWEK